MAKMGDLELVSIIEAQEKRALGYGDGELSSQRADALKYYNGEPLGNEVEGRSQVRTSEVFNTVEWLLPSLLQIFTSSDKAVEFEPERPNDEEGAKQSTTACNYVFYRQNNGVIILHTFFKDALLEKNGYVEVYYDKSERTKKESYKGLSREQLIQLVNDDGVELLEATSYPDPTYQPQPMDGMQPDPMAAGVAGAVAPELYDVRIEKTGTHGRVCVENVAPEEMLIETSHKEVDLANANFVERRFQKTISELEELGYDTKGLVVRSEDTSVVQTSAEFLARQQYDEEKLYTDEDTEDPTMRKVWVRKTFIRVDFDGDGVAELRRVVSVGKTILENEETDVIPFASCTPIIQPHRHIGKSMADVTMELEKINTTLTRQILDNIYLTNSPRIAVQSTPEGAPMANLDDLLTVRPGGVVRHWGSRDPAPLTVPFMGQYGIQALEYMNTVLESRTGVTKYNQGLDADSLNKTAHGISQIMTASQQRTQLIARVFAEGVKQIFKLIQHCLMTYQDKAMIIRLTDQFIEVDPRSWSDSYDMVINVGLGTGDKDQQLAHLMKIAEAQFQYLKLGAPIVTMENVYHTHAKMAENAGFKNVEDFWTDPKDAPPQQQQPDPQAQAEQAKMQLEAAKMQQAGQMEQQKTQMQAQLEQVKLQASQQTEQMKLQAQAQLEQMRMQADAQKAEHEMQMRAFEAERQDAYNRWKVEEDNATKVLVAEISADAAAEKAAATPNADGSTPAKPKRTSHVDRVAESVIARLAPSLESHTQNISAQGEGLSQVAQMIAQQVQGMGGKEVVGMERIKGPDGRLAGVRKRHADGSVTEVAVQ